MIADCNSSRVKSAGGCKVVSPSRFPAGGSDCIRISVAVAGGETGVSAASLSLHAENSNVAVSDTVIFLIILFIRLSLENVLYDYATFIFLEYIIIRRRNLLDSSLPD